MDCVIFLRKGSDIEGIFLFFFVDAPAAKVLPLAPDGDELPAPAQSGLFGTHTFALDAPALQPPVFFHPSAVMSVGKKTPGAT
ncbi:MAG: hypothetical protein EA353_09100 [Puniceicoccaceae bacterium]|nr:MAG: hypothetical protein EA353_09100 [Puniceicoccaceae bacterium]